MITPLQSYAKIICFMFDWALLNFFGLGEPLPLHSLDWDFNSGSKFLIQVSSIATTFCKNSFPSRNLSNNCAISKPRHFCSSLRSCGTHLVAIRRLCKCSVTMRYADVGDIPAECAVSSHVILRSSSRIWSTRSTLWSSVDVRGRSVCSTFPHESAVPSVNLCFCQQFQHHTSISELWISVGVFPRNVLILMYARWSSLVTVTGTWAASISTLCRFDVHTLPGGETHCTSFQTFSSTTAELAGPMAPLVRRCCQSVHFFWNDLHRNFIPRLDQLVTIDVYLDILSSSYVWCISGMQRKRSHT